jgi:hypothetical protein
VPIVLDQSVVLQSSYHDSRVEADTYGKLQYRLREEHSPLYERRVFLFRNQEVPGERCSLYPEIPWLGVRTNTWTII